MTEPSQAAVEAAAGVIFDRADGTFNRIGAHRVAQDALAAAASARPAQADGWADLVQSIDMMMQQVTRAQEKDLPGLLLGSYKEIGRIVANNWPKLRAVVIKSGG